MWKDSPKDTNLLTLRHIPNHTYTHSHTQYANRIADLVHMVQVGSGHLDDAQMGSILEYVNRVA